MTEASGQSLGVTLVVACFNHEYFVEECLESVYAQTLPVSSVIITDDASTDGTQARVRELLETRGWSATTVFHEHNRGICATFNEALALVETPYVAFISADDWMDPHRVEEHSKALDAENSACLVYGNMYLASSEGTPTGETYDALFRDGWPGGDHEELFPRLIEMNWIPAPSVMSRTEALRRVGGFDEMLPFEDKDMWLRLAKAGYPFIFSPRPLVYYRQHESQISKSPELRAVSALTGLRVYAKHVGFSPGVDAWLKPRLEGWARKAFRNSDDTRQLAPTLWRVAFATRSSRVFCLACLASIGISGPMLFELHKRSRKSSVGLL